MAGAALAVAAACGGTAVAPGAGVEASFDEGSVTVGIDRLDTGLLKGNATAKASKGWRVVDVSVTVRDPKGTSWEVLEFPQGVGSAQASEFFEVVVQELPRHQQIEITAIVTFEDAGGARVERRLVDTWPP